jgi:hypothetical protein
MMVFFLVLQGFTIIRESVARWIENKKQICKYFQTKEEAIECRKQMVDLHYSKEHYIESR